MYGFTNSSAHRSPRVLLQYAVWCKTWWSKRRHTQTRNSPLQFFVLRYTRHKSRRSLSMIKLKCRLKHKTGGNCKTDHLLSLDVVYHLRFTTMRARLGNGSGSLLTSLTEANHNFYGKMSACCVSGCKNRYSSASKLKFYRIPTGHRPFQANRRRLWLEAIRRATGSTEELKGNARICGAHFVSGKIYDFTQ